MVCIAGYCANFSFNYLFLQQSCIWVTQCLPSSSLVNLSHKRQWLFLYLEQCQRMCDEHTVKSRNRGYNHNNVYEMETRHNKPELAEQRSYIGLIWNAGSPNKSSHIKDENGNVHNPWETYSNYENPPREATFVSRTEMGYCNEPTMQTSRITHESPMNKFVSDVPYQTRSGRSMHSPDIIYLWAVLLQECETQWHTGEKLMLHEY